jgi:HPt (histidine-containing phosphotransfer) domain-containing protein
MAEPAQLIDEGHFEVMTGGDKGLQTEVLGLFRAQAELWKRLLTADAPDSVWRDAAHALKGSARGIGAFELAEACADAEDVAKAPGHGRTDIETRLSIVHTRLDAALDDIARVETLLQRPTS